MKNAWLIGLLFFLLPYNVVIGQQECNLSISGKVLDEHDGSPLAFSSIWILSLSKGVSADEEGRFVLDKLCKGNYEIVVSHIGCNPDTILLKIKNSVSRTFVLEHHLEELETVQISDELRNASMESETISDEDLHENSGKPLAEILESINGVNSIQTGSNISKPVIGGFTANRVQIVNQGIQLQSQQWGDEHAPEIDPFAAANYTVIKGAGAVKHSGGAIGGIVLIEPKALPRVPGIGGELNSLYAMNNRMYNTSLMLEGNSKYLPKFSWRAQGSWKRSGNIRTPNYYQKNTGVKELNGSFDAAYFGENWNARVFYSQFNSDIGIFSGAHIGNLTDLRAAINRSEPRAEDREGFSYTIRRPKQRIIHELIKTEMNWYSDKWGKLVYRFSRQFNIREEFDKELPRNDELAALDIPEFSLGLESYTNFLNWNLAENKYGNTEVGVQWIDLKNSVNSFTDFIPDYTSDIYSLFALNNWSKGVWKTEIGVRLDHQELKVNRLINRKFIDFSNKYTAITLNAGAVYQLKEESSVRFNFTYAERAPAINELYSDGLHHGSASLEFGNSSLDKEKSKAISTTLTHRKAALTYELYGYSKWIEDFIYLQPNGLDLTIRGAFPSYNWSNANAFIAGFDQSIGYQLSQHWKIYNKASFLWGSNLSNDNFLINMPANRLQSGIEYRRIIRKKENELKISMGHQYVFQQKRFNPEEEFALPPKEYQLLNATINYHFKINQQRKLELGIRTENLFNKRYRDYLNRFRFYSDEQGRDIVFRVQLTF